MSVTKAQLQRLVEDLHSLNIAVSEFRRSTEEVFGPFGLDRDEIRRAHRDLKRKTDSLQERLFLFGAGHRNDRIRSSLKAMQGACAEIKEAAQRQASAAISLGSGPLLAERVAEELVPLHVGVLAPWSRLHASFWPLLHAAGFDMSDELALAVADLLGLEVPLPESEPVEAPKEEPWEPATKYQALFLVLAEAPVGAWTSTEDVRKITSALPAEVQVRDVKGAKRRLLKHVDVESEQGKGYRLAKGVSRNPRDFFRA